MSYPYSHLPEPLPAATFYVLLALTQAELHSYALISACANLSLGSVKLTGGTLYPLLQKLQDQALIDPVGKRPAGKSGKPRLHYRTSEEGILRLKEEFQRLEHVMKIGRNLSLMDDTTPIDIQRLQVLLRP